MEIAAEIRCITNRGLNDTTRLKAGTLRRSLAFRLLMLRLLWSAEPVRILEMDHWMSHINNEMTARLDSLEVFTQTRKETTKTVAGHNAFTGKEDQGMR